MTEIDVHLNIVLQPPSYIFADEWFNVEIELSCKDGSNFSRVTHCPICINADLLDTSKGEVWNKATLTIDQDTLEFSSNFYDKSSHLVRFKISLDNTCRHESVLFCLKIFMVGSKEHCHDSITSVMTTPIRLATSKLVLEAANWEPIWYKDEGRMLSTL